MQTDQGALNDVAFSVVVPVYNAQLTLSALNDRLLVIAASISSSFELIYVDDASTDDSWLVLQQLATNNPGIVVLRNDKNHGQSETTMLGIRIARGKIIATIDDDLEYRPEDLSALYRHLDENKLLLVYGMRKVTGLNGLFKYIRNRLIDMPLGKLSSSSFRVFRSEIISNAKAMSFHTFEGLEQHLVPKHSKAWLTVEQDKVGLPSRYTFGKRLRFWFTYAREIKTGKYSAQK